MKIKSIPVQILENELLTKLSEQQEEKIVGGITDVDKVYQEIDKAYQEINDIVNKLGVGPAKATLSPNSKKRH
jgi:hypothetical protein